LAIGEFWQTVENGVKESISGINFIKENTQSNITISRHGCLMEKLDLKCKSLVSNVMFTWLTELNPRKSVSVSHPVEGSTILNWEEDLITSVKEDNWSRVVSNVGWVVQVEWSSRRTSLRETDG